ncbi:MAG: PEP-CTERM sorting domain-containing protein [Phycisphaerales bacterium]
MKNQMNLNVTLMAAAVASASMATAAHGAVASFGGTGANAAGLTPSVDNFRTAVGGPVNAPGSGPFATGRREINWDAGALDAFASPSLMPNNFFNNNSKRGATFVTAGDGFLVSQRTGQAGFTSLRFGDIDASYPAEFAAFSNDRLFAARNSTVTDVFFFVPSSPTTPATVSSFGAIFADVDSDSDTFVQFFDLGGVLLHTVFASPLDKGLSFAGARFDAGERIARVRITSGNTFMAPGVLDGGANDIVVMDDFIYSEPIEVPAPGTAAALAGLALAGFRRRR